MSDVKYKIRVVRGAFIDPSVLDSLGAVTVEKFSDPDWLSLDELIVTLEQIKELQKSMVKHSGSVLAPWYLDGYEAEDKNKILVAFGNDDGENGKQFLFDRDDEETIQEVVSYGMSKGIPKEQMDFAQIDF